MQRRGPGRLTEIMATHYPSHIPEEVDERIRARFDIRIDRRHMRVGGDRW